MSKFIKISARKLDQIERAETTEDGRIRLSMVEGSEFPKEVIVNSIGDILSYKFQSGGLLHNVDGPAEFMDGQSDFYYEGEYLGSDQKGRLNLCMLALDELGSIPSILKESDVRDCIDYITIILKNPNCVRLAGIAETTSSIPKQQMLNLLEDLERAQGGHNAQIRFFKILYEISAIKIRFEGSLAEEVMDLKAFCNFDEQSPQQITVDLKS